MGAKKKSKKEAKPKEEPKIIIPDFTPHELGPLPISVKVYHLDDFYIIYTDEYAKSIDIKQKLSTLIKMDASELNLFLKNRRPLEDETSNHDQQINNDTEVYITYKGEKINDILKAAQIEVKPNNNP